MKKIRVRAADPNRVGLYVRGPEFSDYPENEVVISGEEAFLVPATAQVMDALRRGNLILVDELVSGEEGDGGAEGGAPPPAAQGDDFSKVKGIGEKLDAALKEHGFYWWIDVAGASDEELDNVPGMTMRKVEALKEHAQIELMKGSNGDPQ